MGGRNRGAWLDRLQALEPASRASLAKSLGLSQPTAGKIVDQLIAMGVVEEVDVSDPEVNGFQSRLKPVGRPARMLRLNRTPPRFLGIQLGISETSLAVLPLAVSGDD